jgi:hypothetical protein
VLEQQRRQPAGQVVAPLGPVQARISEALRGRRMRGGRQLDAQRLELGASRS